VNCFSFSPIRSLLFVPHTKNPFVSTFLATGAICVCPILCPSARDEVLVSFRSPFPFYHENPFLAADIVFPSGGIFVFRHLRVLILFSLTCVIALSLTGHLGSVWGECFHDPSRVFFPPLLLHLPSGTNILSFWLVS